MRRIKIVIVLSTSLILSGVFWISAISSQLSAVSSQKSKVSKRIELLGVRSKKNNVNSQSSILPPEARLARSGNPQSCSFFKWFDPNTNDEEGKRLLKNCSSCHLNYYEEWINDKHSMSQNNPFFLSIYSGKSGKASIYPGFKLDHPDQNGNCALCHNPEAILPGRDVPMGLYDVDLRETSSLNTNGISCDFCHKIESIDQNPLKKGVSGLNIFRDCKGLRDVRFGPIKDPVQIAPDKEELKYNSLYKTSLVCAKCHDGSNGNVQIYSTFTEWLDSPAAKRGVQCQTCHMAPREEANVIVDNPKIKHKKRPYYEVHSHSFLTEDPHEFRKKFVDLSIRAGLNSASAEHETLTVTCTVSNNNPGHSFPTSSPMRNAVLVVEAKDKNGNDLKLIHGPRLPNYAGDLKNKPGRLFAKILEETSGEYARQHGEGGIKFRKAMRDLGIPAQDWWNVFVLSDTRIKANSNDVSVYEFDVRAGLKPTPTEITAKLIWRNTWPGLAKIKGVKIQEDVLLEKKLPINP